MQKEILLQDKRIRYVLRQTSRVRWMRLTVGPDGRVTVTTPICFSEGIAERFLLQKAAWVVDKLDFFRKFSNGSVEYHGKRDCVKYKDEKIIEAIDILELLGK